MKRMSPPLIAAALVAAAVAAFALRPIKPPETTGTWRPAERHHSHR